MRERGLVGGMALFAAAAVMTLFIGSNARAQNVQVGDQIEASPLMMNSHWEACTVTALLPGGDVAVACGPRKTDYVVQSKWVRPAAGKIGDGAAAPAAKPGQTAKPPGQTAMPNQGGAAACADAPRGLVGNRQQENGVCRIGAVVSDRQGRSGTVIDAPDRTTCRVCLSDGTHRDYLTWMLSAGGAAQAAQKQGAGGAAPSGNYQCSGGAAGNMRITISGGRWNEFYAATLPDGRVGVSARPNGAPYYMICERR